MNFTYPKSEKLKSKITIDLLFLKGKSVSKYPLRLIFVESDYGIAELSDPLKIFFISGRSLNEVRIYL